MFGAVVGDVAGSTYERRNCKNEKLVEIFARKSRCTDDSILTLATAKYLVERQRQEVEGRMSGKKCGEDIVEADLSYARVYQEMGRKYPKAGYGKSFSNWVHSEDQKPYGSWGNGSAMRVSPIGWFAQDLDWAMQEAKASAEVTHNHPEAIKGAQAVAAAVFMARTGSTKAEIRDFLQGEPFCYNLSRKIREIRPQYTFDVSCQGSVPEAIISFLESKNFEGAIRKAISLGGDSDTIACISGAIAHAFYGEIPEQMITFCRGVMDDTQLAILDQFWEVYYATRDARVEPTNLPP